MTALPRSREPEFEVNCKRLPLRHALEGSGSDASRHAYPLHSTIEGAHCARSWLWTVARRIIVGRPGKIKAIEELGSGLSEPECDGSAAKRNRTLNRAASMSPKCHKQTLAECSIRHPVSRMCLGQDLSPSPRAPRHRAVVRTDTGPWHRLRSREWSGPEFLVGSTSSEPQK